MTQGLKGDGSRTQREIVQRLNGNSTKAQ